MQFVFIQDLYLLTFPDPPPARRFLGEDLMFVREPETIAQLVSTVFSESMSLAQAETTKRCSAHLCVLNQHDQSSMEHDLVMAIAMATVPLSELFLQALWLVKDHGGDMGAVYVAAMNDGGHVHTVQLPHSGVACTAHCLKPVTAFDESELDRAFEHFAQLCDLAPKAVHGPGAPKPSAIMAPSRLGRALHVVQGARHTSDVGMKIAHYCICLESIFSTDSNGVSQRVAERAARMLGENGAEQQAIFKNVKGLYAVRSTVVHGNQLSPTKETEIRNLAVIGDDYIRRILVKMIQSPDLRSRFSKDKNKALDAFFLSQMFPTN